jgi:hypothetical protein
MKRTARPIGILNSAVSKVIAIALLLVFACDTPLSALFAGSESKLPACCRRNGKHHCASMNMPQPQPDVSGPAINALQKKCPFFPAAVPGQTYTETVLPKQQATSFALIFSNPAGRAQTEARFRLSFSRASQKRGPPALL